MHTSTFWLKFGSVSPTVTLKNRSRSQKPNQLFYVPMLYPCKSGWNLLTSSWDMVHTSTFWLIFGSLNPVVTLKIRSRSPKPNQLFIMSQCYIHANLVKIHPLVHEISCIQESVTPTPTPTGSLPKTMSPCPSVGEFLFRIISSDGTLEWKVGWLAVTQKCLVTAEVNSVCAHFR